MEWIPRNGQNARSPTTAFHLSKNVGARRCIRSCLPRLWQQKSEISYDVHAITSLQVGALFDRWAIDIAGLFQRAADCNAYVLMMTEYRSRYSLTEPLPNHRADIVAEFIWRRIVNVFGPFRELLSDGAPEMVGTFVKDILAAKEARALQPSPYRPKMMELLERFNCTLKDMLAMFVHAVRTTGCDIYHSLRIRTILVFKLLSKHLFSNMCMGLWESSHRICNGWLLVPKGRLNNAVWKKVRQTAYDALKKAQATMKRFYDRQVTRRLTFTVDDFVWVFYPGRAIGIGKLLNQ